MAKTKPENQAKSHAHTDVEQVCRQFETDSRQGKTAKMADYIQGWEEPERSRLLCELIGIEIAVRQDSGKSVQPQEFLDEFPDDQTVVNEAFSNKQNLHTVLPTALLETLSTATNLRNLRFLAEGGLGQVFIAEDESLRRDAAVKLIREDLTTDAQSCEQFRVEAEVTGRLDHPGIPIVYAVGQTTKGRLFYAMQYVRGTGLDKLIRKHHKEFAHEQGTQWFGMKRLSRYSNRKHATNESGAHPVEESPVKEATSTAPLDLQELLAIFISVCHTIGYAHRRGILHRDIKPANVIYGKFGETVVIDWGLALPVARQGVFKDIAEQTIAPRSGKNSRTSIGCIGTPAFMSPEQARGDVPLTPASDIFSLGTLLYCILTGIPPFQGQTIGEVRQHAIDCEFPLPNTLVKDLPPALQSICLKAMRAQISERYRTTHEIVNDIRLYLSDRPVSAHVETPHRRLSRWMRHHTQAVLTTMLVVSLIASSIGFIGIYKNHLLSKEKVVSEYQRNSASSEKRLREQSLEMAADLAARTLANKMDIIYRTLELKSMDSGLKESLIAVNAQDSDAEKPLKWLQDWLNKTVESEPPSMQFRSWFVLSQDGTFLARTPLYTDNKPSASIGKNFAFRDYFHGLGQDLPPSTSQLKPLAVPHHSAAIFSTMDQEMTLYFSVPVFSDAKDPNSERIGVIAVCVECREFSDLKLSEQSDDQQLLLVESRGYPMVEMAWNGSENQFVVQGTPQWSAGILLHHESPLYKAEFNNLDRVNRNVLQAMQQPGVISTDSQANHRPATLFKEGVYSDPIQIDKTEKWLAAYCPVRIDTRSNGQISDTGWFVIVQQKSVDFSDNVNP